MVHEDDHPAERAHYAPQVTVVPLHAVGDVITPSTPPLPLGRADEEESIPQIQHAAQDHKGL